MSDQPRCKRCGKPLRDPLSVAAGLGPVCRGSTQTRKNKRGEQRMVKLGSQSNSSVGGSEGPSATNNRPMWRVYSLVDGEIEAILALHRERYGKPRMVLLAEDVEKGIYNCAKRQVVIVIKNRKVMPGQVWVI